MQKTLALILAGGSSPELSVLTSERAEAALSFAGKYRIIDFPLTNCVNSGIYHVGVLTQYRPRSLHAHLGVGRPWDLDRTQGGLRVLHPFPTPEGGGWQRGTADAVRYNLDFIEDQPAEDVLILSGDHIYKMDYRPMLQVHRENRADVTLAVHGVSPHETHRYGIVSIDDVGRVGSFVEKPRRPTRQGFRDMPLASMGVYAFRKDFLINVLRESDVADFGRELLPKLIETARTFAYPFQGYWADAGTVRAYYEANTSLLIESPVLDLHDPEWVIHTPSAQRPGVEIGETARIENSLVSDGCRIQGYVTRSVLSPGVFVSPGAIVRDSIILSDTWVGSGAVIDRCIVDEHVRVGNNVLLGDGDDNTPNDQSPNRLNTGLTLVGIRTHIPDGVRIGRNVVIFPRIEEAQFRGESVVPSGTTLLS
jgi:glucose-1-phosphate adenylyltransferase